MNFNITEVLVLLVIFQLLFISFFLFSDKKGRRISNILLGAFFMSFCLNLLDSILLLKRVYIDFPSFALWGSGMPLLYGPLLYLYVQSVLFKDFSLSGTRWLHFIPFLLLTLASLTAYHMQSDQQQINMLEKIIEREIPPAIYAVSLIIYIHFLFYIFRSLKWVALHRQVTTNQFSDTKRTNLYWLRYLILFITGLMLFGALGNIVSLTGYAYLYYLFLTILLAGFIIFIIQVLLKAVRHPEIFWALEDDKLVQVTPESPVKYAGSSLQEDDKKRIKASLLQQMEAEKPWMEPELSLEQLAQMLEIKPRILSQVINELFGQNFFDFINHYRIEAAKQLLSNPPDPKLTVLEVLYEVGFNSKSSFNTLFKKQTGLTPSEFKKKHQQRSDS